MERKKIQKENEQRLTKTKARKWRKKHTIERRQRLLLVQTDQWNDKRRKRSKKGGYEGKGNK